MVRWLGILVGTFRSAVRTRRELALENLALRQQLAVWKARAPRPRGDGDGPDLLDGAVQTLGELAEFLAGGAARDRSPVAPPGLQAVLGSAPIRSAYDQYRAPRSDSADEP